MTTPASFKQKTESYVSTTNACKLCKPLGACLAFRGIEGCVPFLHGSQGCATYMRRYIISHFREPIDIASSSLGEKHAVYGGAANLKQGIKNVMSKYEPDIIGIATTCLTETIGDDVANILWEFIRETRGGSAKLPAIVNVATPSYSGTHMEGFHAAVRATIAQLATSEPSSEWTAQPVNLLPGLVSPGDLRHLKEILADFELASIVLPDISETLDAPAQLDYDKIPDGGTCINDIRSMGASQATVEWGRTLSRSPDRAGKLLADRYRVPLHAIGTPIGIRESDRWFETLEQISDRPTPRKYQQERGRLVDAYVDGHKYIFGKRALVYGEEDLIVGVTSFLAEIGIRPVLCATGGASGHLQEAIAEVTDGILPEPPLIRENVDFYQIAEEAENLGIDIIVGHSKGYSLARKLEIPLIRVGFPIHDRFGGQRTLHIGYRGTQTLFDRIVNAVIEKKQVDSPVGYGYL